MKVELRELDVSTIITALASLDYNELKRVETEAKYRKLGHFRVGTKVSFLSNKGGGLIKGKIDKINPKTYGIKTEGQGNWKVSKGLVELEG